ncbi:MAG TPA: DUF3576 domain-containing protein [Acetobacteraceae bacterium]|jgi:hypothetical protein|nr:DUF3576 domain-containing protein [Acetobacteraceae bacterium]
MAFRLRTALGLLLLPALASCGLFGNSTPVSPETYAPQNKGPGSNVPGSILGPGGLSVNLLGNGNGRPTGANSGAALGVNAYLWRGALDTLSFMPLASADPFGGVIITDWWQPPQAPDERFKATAYILGRELTAGALRVAVYRQVLKNGSWVDADVSPQTVADIENRVLDRARILRAESGGP